MEVTVSEAKAKFFDLSEKAAQGNDVIISKRGRPQSVIIGYQKYEGYKKTKIAEQLELIKQIRKHRSKQKLQPDCVEIIRELRQGDTE